MVNYLISLNEVKFINNYSFNLVSKIVLKIY